MPIETITYPTATELIEQACTEVPHPATRALYATLVQTALAVTSEKGTAEQEEDQVLDHVLEDLINTLASLRHTLSHRRQFPHVPTNPHEQQQMAREAVAELVTRWDYRDVTRQVQDWYTHDARATGTPCTFAYLCVLQRPDGNPVYCRTLQRLLATLDEARRLQRVRTAPEPEAMPLWTLIGNFDLEPEEGKEQRNAPRVRHPR
jgi:hypothetical protein